MCIVCEIKRDLKKGANKEVIEKVEALAGAVHFLSEEMLKLKMKGIFKADVMDKARSARELLEIETVEELEDPGDLFGLLLAAMLGGAKVETLRVEVREGETPEQAIARTMAERESEATTKH